MKKNSLIVVVIMVLALALSWGFWMWFFCRFYVPPNQMAVITAKVGDPLPPGQILAKKGQLGVQEEVLGEGRHFLNPILYQVSIRPVITIPPGKVGIVTSKVGEDLPPGQFLADRHQKGIWKHVLGPGRYRINPEGYSVDIVDAVNIPIGYTGVVTSLSGEQAKPGEFANDNEKGVRADVLQPGLYYVNPKMYKVDVLEIGVNQVSLLGQEGGRVITKGRLGSQNLAMAKLAENLFEEQRAKREEYQRQVLEAQVQSVGGGQEGGSLEKLLSRNAPQRSRAAVSAAPKAGAPPQASLPESGEVALEFLQNVEFPSRDGFLIHIDMTVEFELLPKNIAGVFRNFGDLPAVVDKIILPQIQSVSRLKGSAYRAKDLIVGEGRETFQHDLKTALESTLGEKGLVIHNALIRHIGVPNQILDPIQKSSIAIEEDLTNKEKQNTAKRQAELNTELSLIEQASQQVAQETIKLKAEILAAQQKQVSTIRAETNRKVAEIEKNIADVKAATTLKLGSAQADVTRMVEGEKAKGLAALTSAFGDPAAYNLYQFALQLPSDLRLRIIHAGEGTLWTDLEKASLSVPRP